MSLSFFYALCGAVLGAALGSYLGSFRWRLLNHVPLQGRSRCPGCGQAVPAHQNIPVLSYLLLGGRAACCGSRLSPSYPLFEAVTLLVGAAAGGLFHLPGLIFLALMIVGGTLLVKAVYGRLTPVARRR